MNVIEIKQTYLNHQLVLRINQEEISLYGNLSALTKRPFCYMAIRLIPALDNELCDLYIIELTGTTFQYEILKQEVKKSRFCMDIFFHPIPSLYSPEYIQQRLVQLCAAQEVSVDYSAPINIYSEPDFPLPKGYIYSQRCIAQLCLLNNAGNDSSCSEKILEIIIQNSGQPSEMQAESINAVYYIPFTLVTQFLEHYKLFHQTIPCIENCLQVLKYCRLGEKEQAELQSITTTTATYYMDFLPDYIDEGEEYDFHFESFPSGAFHLICSPQDSISIKNSKLIAKKSGIASIFVINQAKERVETRKTEIISHNYAREIHFISDLQAMTLHSQCRLPIAVLPADAEDLDELKWSVEPFSAAQITNTGEITALQPGIVKIKVSGKRTFAERTITIQVAPVKLQVNPSFIQIAKGDEIIVSCDVTPEGAAAGKLSWSFDNPDIAIINPSLDGTRCKLVTTGRHSGTGNIKCTLPTNGIAAICNVVVTDNRADKLFSTISFILLFLSFFWFPFVFAAVVCSGYGLYINRNKEKLGGYWFCLIASVSMALFCIYH